MENEKICTRTTCLFCEHSFHPVKEQVREDKAGNVIVKITDVPIQCRRGLKPQRVPTRKNKTVPANN